MPRKKLQTLHFLVRDPQLLACSGWAPFCLSCSDLFSGGLCGPSAGRAVIAKPQGYTAGVVVGGAALCLVCRNGGAAGGQDQ